MKSKYIVPLILFNFALGIFMGVFLNSFFTADIVSNREIPATNLLNTIEMKAPFDRIHEDKITVTDKHITIDLSDLQGRDISWATYADTKSMVPTFGKGCNGLEFVPESLDEVHVGDMVAFSRDDSLIIHRVVQKGIDENGKFLITKGDNNQFTDGKVRKVNFVTFGLVC